MFTTSQTPLRGPFAAFTPYLLLLVFGQALVVEVHKFVILRVLKTVTGQALAVFLGCLWATGNADALLHVFAPQLLLNPRAVYGHDFLAAFLLHSLLLGVLGQLAARASNSLVLLGAGILVWIYTGQADVGTVAIATAMALFWTITCCHAQTHDAARLFGIAANLVVAGLNASHALTLVQTFGDTLGPLYTSSYVPTLVANGHPQRSAALVPVLFVIIDCARIVLYGGTASWYGRAALRQGGWLAQQVTRATRVFIPASNESTPPPPASGSGSGSGSGSVSHRVQRTPQATLNPTLLSRTTLQK